LLLAGVLFLVLLPYVIIVLCPRLDSRLGLQGFYTGAVNYFLGLLLIGVGGFFALWSIYAQVTRGRGTPLPVMPTQELLTSGPFRYCRNPMTLGTILAYGGLAVVMGTPSGVALVLLLASLLIFYLKRFEERELGERFGEAYLAYKEQVPFIIPRRPKRL
jgi:protein-S-isoprenylcysteine O-methyltransferase Ste14